MFRCSKSLQGPSFHFMYYCFPVCSFGYTVCPVYPVPNQPGNRGSSASSPRPNRRRSKSGTDPVTAITYDGKELHRLPMDSKVNPG